jgi:hypothetical protein
MALIGGESQEDITEMVNNTLGDLAAILALFAGAAIKQFLSSSLGWCDHVLLASGPIGILTIVVAAIRIAGPRWLKTVIGRRVQFSATCAHGAALNNDFPTLTHPMFHFSFALAPSQRRIAG